MGELAAGEGELCRVRAGGHHQVVVVVSVAGRGFHGLGIGVDLDHPLARAQVQRIVLPHGRVARG